MRYWIIKKQQKLGICALLILFTNIVHLCQNTITIYNLVSSVKFLVKKKFQLITKTIDIIYSSTENIFLNDYLQTTITNI